MRFIRLKKISTFAILVLACASAFGSDCYTATYPCIDINRQVQGSRLPSWGVDSGAANAYAITTVAPIGSGGVLQNGSRFYFKATHANTTASTLAVDGGSVIAIKKNVSTALASGDIPLNAVIEVFYDGTSFQLVGNGFSGSVSCGQLPAFTGDVTSSAGSCATTLPNIVAASTQTKITYNAKGQVTAGAQAQFSDLGGSEACSQTPAFTGDVTKSAGSCATTAVALHLSSPPTLCSSGNYARGVDANGNATGCTADATGGGGSSVPTYGGAYCTASSAIGTNSAIACTSVYNVIANHLIISLCGNNQTGATTFADSGPGGGSPLTWTQIATVSNGTNSTSETAWWANPGSATGADTFTCSYASSPGFQGLVVAEVPGGSLSSPIDASATKSGASSQQINLTPTSTSDLVFVGLENSGTATMPAGFFLALNATGTANEVGWGPVGPYHFQLGMGTNGAAVAFAIH